MTDDEGCILAVGKGSEEALEELYDTYCDRVFNTVISYTKNQEDAEEIHQDIFVTIFNTAHSFRSDSSVSTWIYRIAVNKCLDFLRKKNSLKRGGIFTSLYKKSSGELAIEAPDFVHPGVQLEQIENSKLLFRVIENLPDNQKTAFILTQIEDLPQKEAAEIMETSRKAVESLVQRAKGNLKKELEKFYPERGM